MTTEQSDGACTPSVSSAELGGVATPEPMYPGVLIVRTTAGEEFSFDAGTHTYEVWVSEKRRWRKVEITLHTDKGSWIVKTIDFPVSIERRFLTPNVELNGRPLAAVQFE